MKINPFLLTDFYKIGHPFQYPNGTSLVYSNFTPRKTRLKGIDKMVFFGLQYFIKAYLIEMFNENFFDRPKEEVMLEYKRRIKNSIGDLPTYEHIAELWDLGHLPVEIKALKEGSLVDMKIPMLTIKNTHPKFFWLTNFLESLMSAILWQPCTSATLAHQYKKVLIKYAMETGMPLDFVQWQGHDFSFRGMSSLEAACTSGAGHLLSFYGTDTVPAIDFLEKYYNANCEKELIGGSVPATEHSVMCAGDKDGEVATFRRLIKEVYPTGIVSIVSDTWDLWKVCTEYVTTLKEEILSRDGKVVIRPDSGDPVDILCGSAIPVDTLDFKTLMKLPNKFYWYGGKVYTLQFKSGDRYFDEGSKVVEVEEVLPSHKGVIELLWEVFGGTITDKGYKLLDSHIGAIYGDSINIERATQISERLMKKGFASQVVLGIGSYTYQYNTRDTFGMAMKATYVEVTIPGSHGMGVSKRDIYKDPITDDGTKKSAKGLLCVRNVGISDPNGKFIHTHYELQDQCTWEQEAEGELKTVFKDGVLLVDDSLKNIRERLEVTKQELLELV